MKFISMIIKNIGKQYKKIRKFSIKMGQKERNYYIQLTNNKIKKIIKKLKKASKKPFIEIN